MQSGTACKDKDHWHPVRPGHEKQQVQLGEEEEPLKLSGIYDWTYHNVLQDLDPIAAIERPGKRQFHEKHMPGKKFGGRASVRKIIKTIAKSGKDTIKKKIRNVVETGTKITLGVDAWKNNFNKRRHYNCVLAWWVDKQWKRQSACLDVRELKARQVGRSLRIDAVAYKECMQPALEEYGLNSETVSGCLADRYPTSRKAIKDMDLDVLDVLDLELPPMHVLPLFHRTGHLLVNLEKYVVFSKVFRFLIP